VTPVILLQCLSRRVTLIIIIIMIWHQIVELWLSNLVIEHRIHDGEVTGTSLTYCTAKYGPGQATHVHLRLSSSSVI